MREVVTLTSQNQMLMYVGGPHEWLSREQVWDMVFERKTALALKEDLEVEDPNIIAELPQVIRHATGEDVSKWEGIYQLSNGSVVFLEAQYRMSEVS
jgi:hypothetical protein